AGSPARSKTRGRPEVAARHIPAVQIISNSQKNYASGEFAGGGIYLKKAVALAMVASKSLARRRLRPSQAKLRSTTHRRGRSWKPLTPGGRSTIWIVQGPQSAIAPCNCGPR